MPPNLLSLLGLITLLALTSCASLDNQVSPYRVLPGDYMSAVRHESIKLIDRLLEEELVPGLSVALVDSHGPIWVEGFGVANSRTGTKVDPETLFRIGSLTKPVTAIAVMQLVADGKIDLDAPLKDQLAGFSIRRHDDNSPPVTPRQLLSHRSGLPSDLRKGMYTDTPFTKVTTLLHNEYAAYHPDMVYSYSNIGYDLLGHLVQQRSGMTFADHTEQILLAPLTMNSSGFILSADKRVATS